MRLIGGATAVAAAIMLAGCGSSGGSQPSATKTVVVTASPSETSSAASDPSVSPSATTVAEPKTLKAAVTMSREEADRYSSEDYAGAWDLWTKAGQQAIGRSDYVKYHTVCGGGGAPLEVKGVRLEGADQAVVRIGVGNFSISYMPRYEGQQWRWQPTAEDMADYRMGVQHMINKAKREGSCG